MRGGAADGRCGGGGQAAWRPPGARRARRVGWAPRAIAQPASSQAIAHDGAHRAAHLGHDVARAAVLDDVTRSDLIGS